jgi:hypothetical protein
LLAPSLAAASLVQSLDLAELTAQADRIVVAQVVSASSEWDSSGRNIHTRIEITVEEAWKGSVAADGRIVIVQPGGSVGDIEMLVHGMPSFAPGEKAVLFLAGPAGAPRVLGMSQGKRPVRWDGAARRWVAESAEHSAVVRRDSQGGLQHLQRQSLRLRNLRPPRTSRSNRACRLRPRFCPRRHHWLTAESQPSRRKPWTCAISLPTTVAPPHRNPEAAGGYGPCAWSNRSVQIVGGGFVEGFVFPPTAKDVLYAA